MSISDHGWNIWIACYLCVLLGLSTFGAHRFFLIYLFLRNKDKMLPSPQRFKNLPSVTVQLPIYNEIHVVSRLLDAVAALDYPTDLLEIQVLDDSTDATKEICAAKCAKIARKGFAIKHIRRGNRLGFKAGALENGLRSAKGEFLLILDADFLPPRDLLLKVIDHFTDPQVGMVQTRWGHLNRDFSLLTKVQALFLDGHLIIEQIARSRSGRLFNFNGTAGLWRKSCIEDVGGWEHDTLTEDLDLSYRAQMCGWKFVFRPDVVTPAELPVDINGFKTQQHRWTKGAIQTCKKILPRIWRSRLPLPLKIEATAHLCSNFAYLLLAMLCIVLHPTSEMMPHNWGTIAFFHLPIFILSSFSVLAFYSCAQIALHPTEWQREILHLPMLLALGIGLSFNNAKAVLEALFNKPSDFTRTPKYAVEKSQEKWKQSAYAPARSASSLVEALFAVYFGFLTHLAIVKKDFISIPFLLLFVVGFSYVAFTSALSWLPRENAQRNR